MHHIQGVNVEGFWDTHDFAFDLDSHVTFFIGQNGTGKTTLINLMAAALTADFQTLDRLTFRKITITLAPSGKQKAPPQIILTKTPRKERRFELVEYRIRTGKTGSKEIKFALDEAEEELFIRRSYLEHRYLQKIYRNKSTGLIAMLAELVSVNWLSVNRNPLAEHKQSERSFESTVDQKLDSLSNDLVRYFSTLSKQKDDEIRTFQESMIISLVDTQKSHDLFDISRLKKLDEYEDALNSIFDELNVSKDTSTSLISAYMKRGRKLKKRTEKDSKSGLHVEDVMVLVNLGRIEEVVRKWEQLQDRLNSIFAPQERFLRISEQLFQMSTPE